MKVLVATFQTLEIDGDVVMARYVDIVPNKVVIDNQSNFLSWSQHDYFHFFSVFPNRYSGS